MMSLADIAASLPWPVFACDGEKRPVVATGFKAATRDHDAIMAQFDRPAAVMIGVPTGAPSGLIAIDVDVKPGHDGRPWLDENQEALPPTRTHKTRSGGLHLLFRVPDGIEIRNSASRVAPGVDVRGEGGYVIVPPSPGYAVADTTEPADMPRWLIRACMREEGPAQVPQRPEARHERYTQAAIDGEVLAVMRAGEGTRNDTLHKAAIKLGTLVGAGQMSRADAEAELQRAGQMAGLPAREVLATVKSGLDFGVTNPRQMPERVNGHAELMPPEPPDDPAYWQSVYNEAQEAVEPTEAVDPVEALDQDFPATPISLAEFNDIPPREKVYGHFLFRKFISAIGAPGGSGKTAYAFTVALAVVTGKDLLSEGVHDPGPVWIYNLEDPRTELMRRVKAAVVGHGFQFSDIEGKLFLDSGRDRPLVIAQATRDGTVIAWPQVPALIAEIKARGIRLLIVDPFVRSHRVEENVNDQIDFVAALWAQIADAADCSILLVHHFKKGGVSGDAGAFRGASALIDASRGAVTLATMAPDEATQMGVDEKDRWRHVRLDNAKLNLAPPPDGAMWLILTGVDLKNGTPARPLRDLAGPAVARESDSVQTVHKWEPPSPYSDMPAAVCIQILERLNAGPGNGERYYLTGGTSARWAGHVIVEIANKTEAQAKAIIGIWRKNGLITAAQYVSPASRKEVSGMTVDMGMVDLMRRG